MANNNHFSLTLDTLAPTGGITRPAEYLKQNMDMTITKDSTAVYMKVWFDTTPNGTKESEGYQTAAWIAVADTYTTAFNETKGGLYYHLVLMDDVANESEVYNTEMMVFDTSAPVITSAAMFDLDTLDTNLANETTVGYRWACETDPAPAPIVKAYITGNDIDPIEQEISSGNFTFEGNLTFKAGTTDGAKTISIQVEDAAGNISEAKTATITLDTSLDVPTLILTDEDGVSIGEWINYHNIKVKLNCNDTNIVGYKIWEGDNKPADYTTQEAGSLNVSVDFTLSAGDGEKVIHAEVKDAALNTSVAADVTVKIDTVKPVVELSADKSLISNVENFKTATLTLSGTDALSTVASYKLTVTNGEGDAVKSETINSGVEVPASFELTSANALVEGANIIALTVTDKAGNVETKEITITLDTTAPANVEIGTLNEWYNADFNIQVNYSDTHIGDNLGGSIYAWVSTIADDIDVGDVAAIMATSSPQTIAADKLGGTKIQSSQNYVHVKVVDAVGNASYDHKQFGWDTVRPVIEEVKFDRTAYNTAAGTISIRFVDETSKTAYMQITGDITNGQAEDEWVEAATTYGVTFTTDTQGDKTVYVKVKDTAGNICESAVSATAELDMTAPGVVATLLEADGVTVKPNHSPLNTIAIKIAVTDDDVTECEYKIYGAVATADNTEAGIDRETAEWTKYVKTGGNEFITINNLYSTVGDGVKEIYVLVRDNAGNETEAAKMSFELDTAAPIVVVSNVDYNRISKIHVERRNSEGAIAGKFADEVSFTFTPDSSIQAYKVCAYTDQAAAEAGNPATDAAIGNANGSVNMSATGLSSNAAVSAKIKGADFEAALGELITAGQFDGLHFVVVYVQDYAGTWSVAANFSA